MITGAIILFITSVVTFFINLLPLYNSLPTTFTNAWNYISGFIANLLWTIPGGLTFLTILNLSIIVIGAVMLWKFINWITWNR